MASTRHLYESGERSWCENLQRRKSAADRARGARPELINDPSQRANISAEVLLRTGNLLIPPADRTRSIRSGHSDPDWSGLWHNTYWLRKKNLDFCPISEISAWKNPGSIIWSLLIPKSHWLFLKISASLAVPHPHHRRATVTHDPSLPLQAVMSEMI